MLFGDLETVGVTDTLEELEEVNAPLAQVFRNYFDNGTLCRRFPDKECDTAEKMFPQVAALMSEFSKIVAASFGKLHPGTGKWHPVNYLDHDEEVILKQIYTLLEKQFDTGAWLNIYNGKHFDVPLLVRKMIEYGMPGNPMLPTYNMKPWDYRVVDPKDAWQLGTRSALAKLELVCAFLGVESPKNGEVTGASLHDFYWEPVRDSDEEESSRRLAVISDYCARDVVALRDVTKKMHIYPNE